MTEIEWGVRFANDDAPREISTREEAEAWAAEYNRFGFESDPDDPGYPAKVVYRAVTPWTVIETDQVPVLP